MKIENFKIGDVIDIKTKNGQVKRVFVIDKNEDDNMIFGIDQNNSIININPNYEVKKFLFNIFESD